MWTRRCAPLALIALVASSAPIAHAAPPANPDDAARATMQRVFSAMTVLLPASAREGGFSDPAKRDALRAAFAALTAAANDLRAHGSARDASFGLHARNLADDARLASSAFEIGDEEEARFAFTLMTQRCVDCHSRLPDVDDSPLAARLVALPDVKALAKLERVRVDVALRRFDEALATWEEVFADPATAPAEHELGGALADYLTVALRVKGDAQRPQRVLRQLAERDDTPGYLRTRMIAWGISLARVAPRLAQSSPSIRSAREWALMARNLSDLPTARDGLVYDLAASSVLLRWIDARVASGARSEAKPSGVEAAAARAAQDLDLATAYYELAVIEDRTAFSIWAPQTDVYMEAAIRAAPSGPLARRAYARIEEQLLTELGATSPAGLPEQERERLAALRELIASAGPGSGTKP